MQELVDAFRASLDEKIITTPRFSDGWQDDWQTTANLLRTAYRTRVEKEGSRPYAESDQLIKCYTAVAKWAAEGKTSGIIFNGGIGNGKTTMARALCDVIRFRKGILPRKVTALDYQRAVARDEEIVQEWKRERALMIDDIGTEAVSVNAYGTKYSPIAELFYVRYNNRLATICTTNLTRDQFNATYGERVADRVKQIFDWVSFRGGSYR